MPLLPRYWNYRGTPLYLAFYLGGRVLNSGPHASAGSSLSPQPQEGVGVICGTGWLSTQYGVDDNLEFTSLILLPFSDEG